MKPELIVSPHVKVVLEIIKAQCEILKLLSSPAIYIPTEELKKP